MSGPFPCCIQVSKQKDNKAHGTRSTLGRRTPAKGILSDKHTEALQRMGLEYSYSSPRENEQARGFFNLRIHMHLRRGERKPVTHQCAMRGC